MKKGTGSDPFADVADETAETDPEDDGSEPEAADEESADETASTETKAERNEAEAESDSRSESETATDGSATAASTDTAADPDGGGGDAASSHAVVAEPPQTGADDDGIPWVYVRDNVKQDREMVQFYLRDYLVNAEDEFVDAVSDELGTDVSKTDVREAAYEAAMYNVDDVVDRLRAWGFEAED